MTDRTVGTALMAAGAAALFAAVSLAAAARACRCPVRSVESVKGSRRPKPRPHLGHGHGGGPAKPHCPNPPNCN
ncbi:MULTISPECIES: hypothetical protein [unclassified Kitasatospora]|uniref:hypothetical protein n=1 Tax=unclassified Kitasatospora TaxID=2633591 RepID=UPI00340D4AAA